MMGTVPVCVGENSLPGGGGEWGGGGGEGRGLTSTDKHREETVSNGVTDCLNLSVQNIWTI